MFSLQALVFVSLLVCAVFSADWDYDDNGPDQWASIAADCGGETQSPIDIVTNDLERSRMGNSRFGSLSWGDYRRYKNDPFNVQVTNNGHSLKIAALNPDGEPRSNSWNTVFRLDNDNGLFGNDYEHNQYCLDSVHFHWGNDGESGSEHAVDGRYFPLEAHFVHYSCDYPSLGAALEDSDVEDSYVLAVVGIFFELGRSNSALETILTEDVISQIRDASSSTTVSGFDMRAMTPSQTRYWTYEGSLTTPPCTAAVRWHVLQQPLTISNEQLMMFRSLLDKNENEIRYNYRPVQDNINPLYGFGNQGNGNRRGRTNSRQWNSGN